MLGGIGGWVLGRSAGGVGDGVRGGHVTVEIVGELQINDIW